MRLDHVQLAIPQGGEEAQRRFWVDLLGFREGRRPAALAARGGLWLRHGDAAVRLGVEDDQRPARKARPAFRAADLDALPRGLRAAGYPVRWDDALPGTHRFHTGDPAGNRVEFVAEA